jgi:hypothetical protein
MSERRHRAGGLLRNLVGLALVAAVAVIFYRLGLRDCGL